MVCRLTLRTALVTAVHSHVHEQITLVERGSVRLHRRRQVRLATAGDVLLFPRALQHGATMLDEEVVLIDIFSPLRDDFLPAPAIADGLMVTTLASASTARWRS